MVLLIKLELSAPAFDLLMQKWDFECALSIRFCPCNPSLLQSSPLFTILRFEIDRKYLQLHLMANIL